MPALCRDCLRVLEDGPCPCGGRVVRHAELFSLSLAHVDCDAFYASVEKRDRPELASRPVIVGGEVRGVVAAACYVARMAGVRSAMPMFKARRLCPDAVVIRPDFRKYTEVARNIRTRMLKLTPLVQVLSIDEAVLDLAGTEALHGAVPAVVLARFATEVEREVGVTLSVGLARNRLMAKIAAGRDKPRGFSVIGAEAAQYLAPRPVRLLPGIGPASATRLAAMGITTLGQLQMLDPRTARARLGDEGPALVARARGEDSRLVQPGREAKSISAETTFEKDIAAREELEAVLWRLCEKVARRLAENELAAAGVTLKLRSASFATRTRAARLATPTLLPERLFDAGCRLLSPALDATAYRLIGIGADPLVPAAEADPPDLADPSLARRVAAQQAVDALRGKFGERAVVRGRGLPR